MLSVPRVSERSQENHHRPPPCGETLCETEIKTAREATEEDIQVKQ